MPTVALQQLRLLWERTGRPAAVPAKDADVRRKSCKGRSTCYCTKHQSWGAGAYLLSAHGLRLLDSWWPLTAVECGKVIWPRKLEPEFTVDNCVSRIDRNGPPLTRADAQEQWAARRLRDRSRQWLAYIASPPLVMADIGPTPAPTAQNASFGGFSQLPVPLARVHAGDRGHMAIARESAILADTWWRSLIT
ncbi:hypothetical protein T492DRAFT_846587 [Pavlovales sp. CCMP2436]|nr:hypothetical protein T492DRAFT_846587 [Pavlovales sp. CCMP2436]